MDEVVVLLCVRPHSFPWNQSWGADQVGKLTLCTGPFGCTLLKKFIMPFSNFVLYPGTFPDVWISLSGIPSLSSSFQNPANRIEPARR